MSEQLGQQARKIDFGTAENGGNDDASIKTEDGEETEDEEEKPYQQQHWPLESVRNKIRLNAHLMWLSSDYCACVFCPLI